jgi:hypothetical protein
MTPKHSVAVGLLFLCFVFGLPVSFAAVGVTEPRWTDANMADLSADLHALFRAQNRLNAQNIVQITAIERQKQLLGIAEDSDFQSLNDQVREWWKGNILAPAFRIANNPAAGCKVARIVLTKLVAAERQSQLFGIDTHADVDLTDPQSLISMALVAVKRRCLEQAFDACMESGNGQHLIVMLVEATRQFQLWSIDDANFEAQAVYLFRRCTVYQLRFHSQTRSETIVHSFGTTQDGSIILLSDVDPAGGFAGLALSHEWAGPRPADPSDVLGSITECTAHVTDRRFECGPLLQLISPGRVTLRAADLNMKRHFQEVKISEEGRIRSTPRSDGQDELKLTLEPPDLLGMVTISMKEVSVPAPLISTGPRFLIPHGRLGYADIELSSWKRVGNDVLFEKTITGQQTLPGGEYLADTSKFELVHRPDLFPPEEIVPQWELAP